LKIASTRLIIAPTTTIQPAITVMIDGIIGIGSLPLIIPEPTAKETRIPTIHVITPIKLSLIFYLLFDFFLFVVYCKNKNAATKIMKSVRIYVSLSDVVYPRYSVIDPREDVLSGLREQRVHLYIGFGTFGAIRHGMIGINIELTKTAVEAMAEYITFCFNCILLYLF